MTLAIKHFSDDQYRRALEAWSFLDLVGKTPLFATPFGDIFLAADDGIWWLDMLEGEVTRPWASRAECEAALATSDGTDRYLLGGLVDAAERKGLSLGPTQVFGFSVHPLLGGAIDVSNVETFEFVVAAAISGQLHARVRGLPPGMLVSRLSVDGT